MELRGIPGTDVRVSPICLGTMTFGTPVGEREAIALTQWAIDRGINFIDTANMYEGYTRYPGSPGGVCERILGKALAGRRAKVVLATKVGMKVGDAPEDSGTSPAAIRKHLTLSLGRLRTDCIDIYYLHRPDPESSIVEILSALAEAMKAGKIRHYGISNYSAEQTRELLQTADSNGLPRPVIHQPPYSLLKPDAAKDLLPLLKRESIAAAPYQTLQGGLLSGKYRRGAPPPEGSRMREKPEWMLEATEELQHRLEKLEAEAARRGRSLLAHALLESLAQPAVVSLVLGVKRIEQLQALLDAIG